MSEGEYKKLGKETLIRLYLSAKKKAEAYDKLKEIIQEMTRNE